MNQYNFKKIISETLELNNGNRRIRKNFLRDALKIIIEASWASRGPLDSNFVKAVWNTACSKAGVQPGAGASVSSVKPFTVKFTAGDVGVGTMRAPVASNGGKEMVEADLEYLVNQGVIRTPWDAPEGDDTLEKVYTLNPNFWTPDEFVTLGIVKKKIVQPWRQG